jgi:hypothetical protein
VLSACGQTPAPSATPSPSAPITPSPVPSTTPSPRATPSPIPSPSEDPFGGGLETPTPPPLAYDWSTFPTLPTPTLVSGDDVIPTAAVAGCVIRFYEPADDPFGRIAQSDPVCRTGPLPATEPLVVAPETLLVVRAPDGYTLGAEIVEGEESFAIISARQTIPARIDAISAGGTELSRQSGFDFGELEFVAPTEPGDYLITVAAQLGRNDRLYRELDTIFLFRLRVAGA